jgi:sugar lactone lactonase YvrE
LPFRPLERTPMQAELAIDARAKIGEAPVWDAAQQRLLWTDNEVGIIHEVKTNGQGGWSESRRWHRHRPIAAALPRRGGGLILASGNEILALNDSGNGALLARLPSEASSSAFNEAKCDPQGRLWAGTLAADFTPGGAALYRLDPERVLTPVLRNVTVSNGMDWSPDGGTFYYIDSPTLGVDAFDFDGEQGSLSHRRTIITIEHGAGAPDGMTVDREGCLWVAVAGAGEVRRYTPEGKLLARVRISAPAVTSCAFGGDDGGELFITCLGRRLPDVVLALGISPEILERSATAPGAGGLFVCRPGASGAPATPFAG